MRSCDLVMMRDTFYNPFPRNEEAPIQLIACGYEHLPEGFYLESHVREEYLIHHAIEGWGFYEVGQEKYEVQPGDIFVTRPNDVISYYAPDPARRWVVAWFSFTGVHAAEYMEQLGLNGSRRVLRLNGSMVDKKVQECLAYVTEYGKNPSDILLSGFVLKCLGALQHDLLGEDKETDQQAHYANAAIQYIKYNYAKNLRIDEIADYVNIDRSYLYKIFKRYTGMSPQEYLIDHRMGKAKVFLEQGHGIAETAELVGFGDIYSFSASFKKRYGISPSNYKNSLKLNGS